MQIQIHSELPINFPEGKWNGRRGRKTTVKKSKILHDKKATKLKKKKYWKPNKNSNHQFTAYKNQIKNRLKSSSRSSSSNEKKNINYLLQVKMKWGPTHTNTNKCSNMHFTTTKNNKNQINKTDGREKKKAGVLLTTTNICFPFCPFFFFVPDFIPFSLLRMTQIKLIVVMDPHRDKMINK